MSKTARGCAARRMLKRATRQHPAILPWLCVLPFGWRGRTFPSGFNRRLFELREHERVLEPPHNGGQQARLTLCVI
ncbi:MAG TPA: hypothetical protein VK438_16495 [Xanthobacteraceae bacterium]|nr:hypothetical protein [Xanthobacteraceae bacterium]